MRKFPGKSHAVIYDFITLPVPLDEVNRYSKEFVDRVKALAKREVSRIKDFAEIAENPFESDSLIYEIQRQYNIETEEEESEEYYA